jgi:hypothetical protein
MNKSIYYIAHFYVYINFKLYVIIHSKEFKYSDTSTLTYLDIIHVLFGTLSVVHILHTTADWFSSSAQLDWSAVDDSTLHVRCTTMQYMSHNDP